MTQGTAVRTFAVAMVLATTMVQCTDNTGPGGTLDNSIGVIVSGLVRPPYSTSGPAASSPVSAGLNTGIVYLSLPPGSVPAGAEATIKNRLTDTTVATDVVNGGFDPVAIGASVGDTLDITIANPSSTDTVHAHLTVAARRRPRLVRTDPPAGGRDVPLNASLYVVFSQPIDGATLSTGVALKRDTTTVPGTVGFVDSIHVRAKFQPASRLAPLTTYTLVMNQAVRDVNGDVLDSTTRVIFSTGVTISTPQLLAFTVQPSTATVNDAINPAVAVAIEDSSGRIVTSAANVVTLELQGPPGSGVLSGTAVASAVNGIATFSALSVTKPGTGYTLKAVSSGLAEATSAAFDIIPGPQLLAFTVQPGNAIAGAAIVPAVQVTAEDSAGNKATRFNGVISVAIGTNPGSGTLAGTRSVVAVNGTATFSTLSIDKVGTGYTLTASAANVGTATSATFDVSPGVASRLFFTGQPSNTNAAATITPAVQVTARDAQGNTATGFTGSVTIAIGANPGGATLSGTTTVPAVNGVATFPNLSLNNAANGYTLNVSATAVTGATSTSFSILAVPTSLHISTSTTGTAMPTQYSWCVDNYSYSSYGTGCGWSGKISANDSVTVLVNQGTHYVEIDSVARNCTIAGDNPRLVTANGLTPVPFSLACLDTGTVRLSVTTTGADPDPNGYGVCVSRGTDQCFWYFHILANDVATIAGVTAEQHTVTLNDVVANCTAGSTSQTVTVPVHGTADVRFNVGCVVAERIAYSATGTINVARLDGVSTIAITHGFSPAWSADGTRLAYECGADICAINPDGSGVAQLTTDAANNQHPTWSPDGARIAFSATDSGVADLWVMSADGSNPTRLTQNVGFVGGPAWSPDGTRIAFDCQVAAGNNDICVVNTDGTGFVRLTTEASNDHSAAWKPDGTTLAFVTNRYGADQIVLMSSSGGSVSSIGLQGSEPTWSPDGSQLAFVRLDQFRNAYIYTAQANGANVLQFRFGDQPAWKPHP